MAIVTFNKSTFGDTTVEFQFNDANMHMTSCAVTPGQAGQVKIYISDGVNPDVETSTGFSLAPYGDVREITDELGTTYDFPVGMFVRVEYQSKLQGQQVKVK